MVDLRVRWTAVVGRGRIRVAMIVVFGEGLEEKKEEDEGGCQGLSQTMTTSEQEEEL